MRREPAYAFRACLEGVAAVAADFRGNERLERCVQFGFSLPEFRVRESAEGHMAPAARIDPDPRVTWRANPKLAVILAVRVGGFAMASEHGFRAAIVADRLGQGRNGTADAHDFGWHENSVEEPLAYTEWRAVPACTGGAREAAATAALHRARSRPA